jgi:hypothetical protein
VQTQVEAPLCQVEGCADVDEGRGFDVCFRHRLLSVSVSGSIRKLASDRENNVTQQGMKKDMFKRAAQNGHEIRKAGSGPSPTSAFMK